MGFAHDIVLLFLLPCLTVSQLTLAGGKSSDERQRPSSDLAKAHSERLRRLFVTSIKLGSRASAAKEAAKPMTPRTGVAMDAEPKNKAAAAALAAMLLAAPLVADPGVAEAARSGGRAGGGGSFRSAPRAAPRAAPRTVINNNYNRGYGGGGGVMIMPPVISPFSPFGYSPFGGLGTGYALGSMANGGNQREMYRVENEVGKNEADLKNMDQQLQAEKDRNAALEQRLNAIEAKQK